jgi:hypothetical protein
LFLEFAFDGSNPNVGFPRISDVPGVRSPVGWSGEIGTAQKLAVLDSGAYPTNSACASTVPRHFAIIQAVALLYPQYESPRNEL